MVEVGLWGTADSNAGQSCGVWMAQPMLEVARSAQDFPSPYSAGGNEDHANINLFTDVNGNIAGLQVKNDGTTGELNILADVLNVISPGGVDGLELRDGYLRVWKGGAQRIIGNGFGPDNLMDYFGPNVGVGNASKVNATMWMDIAGNAYWGGSLSAGIHKNANRTDSSAPAPYVEVGPFQAFGKPRVVVVSFTTQSPNYNNFYPGRASNDPPQAPSISGLTTLRLRRNVGNGFEVVTQQSFAPGANVLENIYHDRDAGIPELPNGGWQQIFNFSCGGSFTATEPGSTFANFIYEGSITAQSFPQILRQTLSVISTEEP